jgi:hypothetical protein
MQYKVKILITIFIFLPLFLSGHFLYAEQISPLGTLAQNYIERLNEDLSKTNGLVPSSKQKAVIVNPEGITRDAVSESIDTISKTVREIDQEKEKTILEIKEIVKQGIDDSIVEIIKATDKSAYELQSAVDSDRTDLFEQVTQTINSINPTESQKINDLQISVDILISKIQKSLEQESEMLISFDKSQKDVQTILFGFKELLNQKNEIIDSRQGTLVFEDTDSDDVSNYDEMYIYKTDPNKANTIGETGMTDGQKIQAGINPLDATQNKIDYQDPRESTDSFVSSAYQVDKIQLVKEDVNKLDFEGVALPNTFVTLYIYNMPILANVKTNESGQWTYRLEKEFEDGEHQIFVTTVDTSGKIIVRSNSILFTKTADSVIIGITDTLNNSISTPNFWKDNFILIILATLIATVVLGMILVGKHKNIKSAVAELKKEVN